MKSDILTESSVRTRLFGQRSELLPSVTELFELDMAYLERKILDEQALIERSAYFETVNGKPTKHFLRCSRKTEATQGRSAVAKAYFEEGQFSTGYATHGLFPYRGKFHPQLIRGIFNVLGIKEKETVLDPMCGSGTANIEAALMGINSIAVDVSPFCRIMTKAKYDSLTVDKETILKLKTKPDQLFEFFMKGDISKRVAEIKNPEKMTAYEISLLAFLDAMGYAKRVSSRTHKELFKTVLIRYLTTIEDVQSNPFFDKAKLGSLKILDNSAATHLEIEDVLLL